MAICGPKLSLCCLLLSIWGIIQLVLMGIFFYAHSVALVEDLTLEGDYKADYKAFEADVDRAYAQNAYNCWIAACLYLGTFLFSAQQFYVNNKSTSSTLN